VPSVRIALGFALSLMLVGPGWAHEKTEPAKADAAEPVRRLKDAVETLTRQLRDAGLDAAARLGLAAARQRRLAELIDLDPGEVLRQALAPDERARLGPAVSALVEEEVSHEGEFEVLHADAPGGGGRYLYGLRTPAGDQLSLHFARSGPALLTGDRVRVRGVRVAQAMALGGAEAVTLLAAASQSGLAGERKTAVIIVKFSDKPSAAYDTPAQVQATLFGAGSSASDFVRENSYQKAWLTGSVFGPFVIPVGSAGCDYNLIGTLAKTVAQAAGVVLAPFNHHVFVFPTNGCAWAGLATVGGSPGRVWINGSVRVGVVTHELGHNFGLYHSHAWDCGSAAMGKSCSKIEYGDLFDVMGASSGVNHFNAVQKERLGWLNVAAAPPITEAFSGGTYAIDPIETAGTAPKAVKVQSSKGDWYYIEYRKPTGFDANLAWNASVLNGVVIHYWSGVPDGVFLLDMTPATGSWTDSALTVGKSFVDTAGGVSITTSWVDGETAGVTVAVGSSCVRLAPTVVVSPTQQAGPPGAALSYSMSVTNNDVGCAASTFTASATVPAGWTSSGGGGVALLSGATGALTLAVTSAASADAGSYSVGVTASSPYVSGASTATYVVSPDAGGGGGAFSDSFDRPDAQTLGNGWSIVSGAVGIGDNEARSGTTRMLHLAVQSSLEGAFQTAAASFASSDNNQGPQFGVVLRYGAAGYYKCYRQVGGSSALRIARVESGVETILKSVAASNPSKGDFFALSCQATGSTLSLSLDSVTKVTASDATFASGSPGLMIGYQKGSGNAASHRADNFNASVQ